MKRCSPLLAISLILLLEACTTVASVSISQIPPLKKRGTIIRASGSSPIVLGIPFGSNFIDDATASLLRQCQAPGTITGVMVKHQNKHYLGYIYAQQQVFLQGYCTKKKG
ncbi:MAG: hypothetical protein H7318_19440 [Oligoflexus sp.]|nr:hypothetical protein [Oligoflexus sp.]